MLQRVSYLLAEVLGRRPTLFRPPKGQVTAWKLWRLWQAGQTVVLWNADPKDYAHQSVDAVRAWFRVHPLRGGDIVLMHDSQPHAAEVLPDLIGDARRRGLAFTTAADWIK